MLTLVEQNETFVPGLDDYRELFQAGRSLGLAGNGLCHLVGLPAMFMAESWSSSTSSTKPPPPLAIPIPLPDPVLQHVVGAQAEHVEAIHCWTISRASRARIRLSTFGFDACSG